MQYRHRKKKSGEPGTEGSSAVEKPSTRPQETKQKKQESTESDTPKASPKQTPAQGTQPESYGQPDTFSIHQALKRGKQSSQDQADKQEEEDDQPKDTGKDRKEDFSQEQVDRALKALAEEYREKPRLYNMLRSRKPEKQQDNTILIRLENNLQEQQINKIYNTILFGLKDALQNDYLSLKTEIDKDQTSANNKLYTDEDRYKYMEQKNKDLRQLRQDFDLDFD